MNRFIQISFLVFFSILAFGCSTGIETSDPPGILKVYIQPSESDTSITIVNTEYKIDPEDEFLVKVSEGKAYKDTTFFILYRNLNTFNESDITRDLLTGNNGNEYSQQLIYETYLPIGDYDQLEFFLSSSLFQLDGFNVPVITPSGQPLLIQKNEGFSITENDTTSIYLEIDIVESISRVRDTYVFNSDPKVITIETN